MTPRLHAQRQEHASALRVRQSKPGVSASPPTNLGRAALEYSASELAAEMWADVVGFEGFYQVSNIGRVYSCPRPGTNRPNRMYGGGMLKANLSKYYPSVNLCMVGKRPGTNGIHILVAEAFLGPRPSEGHECAHLDGNQYNPRLSNLAWVTVAENHRHKITHGTDCRGEDVGSARLTETDVLAIRMSGEPGVVLARRYGVSQTTISRVRLRRTWRHLPLAGTGRAGRSWDESEARADA